MKMTRLFAGSLLTVVSLVAAPVAQASAGSDAPAPAVAQAGVAPAAITEVGAAHANTILVKVNQLRAKLGLAPVTRYVQLDSVAQDWSEQMAARNVMQHRPDLGNHVPDGWVRVSENVAWRSGPAGEDVGALLFEQWLNSPDHYVNMTDPNVNSIGIGLAYNQSSNSWFGTQNFAGYLNPVQSGLVLS